jgi:CBS domain containing-hemolysin-like protein
LQSIVWLALGIGATGFVWFFALTHHALRWFSRARLEEALEHRGRLQELARLYEHHDALVQTTRLLHIVGLIAWALLAALWATQRLGFTAWGWAAGAALALAGGVVFGGTVPMAWAKYAAEGVLVATLPVCHACRILFSPARRTLGILDALVRRLAGVPKGFTPVSDIEEEIASVVDEGEREGSIEEDQKDMIANVIKFKHADVSQIMTPRTDVVSIAHEAAVEAARRLIAESGYSRIPVTRGNLDSIAGILYAKDLLDGAAFDAARDVRVKDVMRKPVFVPETKRLDELLREFQVEKNHMAVVLDEYGGTAGLVTMEDVVEEIVGEIVDEYEPELPESIRALAGGAFEVDARVHIDELNDELPIALPEHDDYETIGGFVLSRMGYIPKAGESFEHDGLRITVLEAEERRVTRLRIDLSPRAAEAGGPT